MRPIVLEQNPIRYPLSIALGTEAQIRLMRVLAMEIDGPISVADSARRSGLTVPGARKAIARLESAGVLQTTGGGRNTLYELGFDNPLVAAIVRLFDVESERFNELLDELRRKSSAPSLYSGASQNHLCPSPPQLKWMFSRETIRS